MTVKFDTNIKLSRKELCEWTDCHGTSLIIAHAMHMIESDSRQAEEIWDDSTADELESIKIAVRALIRKGIYPAYEDSTYFLGYYETVEILP